MSNTYVPISWNPFKKKYDLFLGSFIGLYLLVFILLNLILFPQLIIVTILIRAFGSLAIIMLHIILMIGPLCRLQPRFLPLLYNRRHFGVTMFLVASVHAVLSLIWFHTGGYLNPLVSLFGGNTHYDSLRFFPFQTLGFVAYIILMFMAFTSHDFWLHFLSPLVWKGLHMMVYLAYSLLILHVMLGIVQLESSLIIFLMLLGGLLTLVILHIWAGMKEWKLDHSKNDSSEKEWKYVCEINDLENNRAKMILVDQERVAVFKYGNKINAVHNVCKHQNGPLGEGKIVDGCIVCPWHGYQYLPENGRAPEPFTEKLATYKVKIERSSIYLNTLALPEGTAVNPAIIVSDENGTKPATPFFIGWSPINPLPILRTSTLFAFGLGFISLGIAVGFISNTKHNSISSYDYVNLKEVKGQLISYPFPAIRTIDGNDKGNLIIKTYPLVNDSKFGANGIVDSIKKTYNTDQFLTVIEGAEIKRNNTSSLELSNGRMSVKVLNKDIGIPKGDLKKIKDTTLLGEIIDPKCYLGAMNPGEGKPHRACAILCIGGGIMPMLRFKGSDQIMHYAVLMGSGGERINQQVLKYVAEPVRITGALYRFDNWFVFYTNPAKQIIPLFN